MWTLKKPKTISKKLQCGFRAPDLSRMLQVFKGEESQGRSVDVRQSWRCYSSNVRIEKWVFREEGILLTKMWLRENDWVLIHPLIHRFIASR